ncbi:MAG: hypothetical protein NZ825_13385 [Candidatus Marinimicrobia bacterium]|nr:hypothetical protein [Candidatus Neomarinimicrobiota bacterium]
MKKEGIIAIVWIVLAFSIGIFLVSNESASNVQSIYYGRLPDFHLTDSRGNDFNYRDILGRVWVIQFSNGAVVELPNLPSEVEKLTVLTNLTFASIENTTGRVVYSDPEKITRLATDGFHFTEELLKEGNSFPLVLVDKSGNIRGYYKQERDKDIERLGRDIDSLLKIS